MQQRDKKGGWEKEQVFTTVSPPGAMWRVGVSVEDKGGPLGST